MNTYRTRDSAFAAYLLTLGFQPSLLVDNGTVWFLFDIPNAKELKDKYFSGIEISAIEYAKNMKLVKAMVANALKYT